MSGRLGRLVVVFNPAGGSADEVPAVKAAFAERASNVEWIETTEADPGIGMARTACQDGVDMVIAAGGDGTVRACAEGVLGTGIPLGIIPMGTGNLLARGLGIPLDPVEAIDTILSGNVRIIDVGTANDEPFVVIAGLGLDARMILDSRPDLKARFGTAAYVLSGLRHLRRDAFGVELVLDGESVFYRSSMILIGNLGELPGGLLPFPDADPGDGVFEVMVVRADSLWAWAGAILTLPLRRPPARLIRRHRAQRVVLDVGSPQPYEVDGEARDYVRAVEFAVRPASLPCIVPEDAS